MHVLGQRQRAVFHPSGHDDEFSGSDVSIAGSKLHAQAPLDDEKQLVFPLMVVPDELPSKLHDFHVGVVELADDLGAPDVLEQAEFLLEVHGLHRDPPGRWS